MLRFDGTQIRLDGVMHRPALSEAARRLLLSYRRITHIEIHIHTYRYTHAIS